MTAGRLSCWRSRHIQGTLSNHKEPSQSNEPIKTRRRYNEAYAKRAKTWSEVRLVFVSPSEWLTKWRAYLKPIAKPCNAKPKQSSENRALPVVVLCESMFYVNKHTLAVELLLK